MCDLKNAQNKAFGVESYQIHIFFRPKLKLQHFIKQMIDLFRIRYLLDIRHIFILDNKGGQAPPEILFHTLSSQPSLSAKERYLTVPLHVRKKEATRIEPLQLPPTLRMTANVLGEYPATLFKALQRLSSELILQKRRHMPL